MKINGDEGNFCSVDRAATFTKRSREKHPNRLHSQVFGKEKIQKLLDQRNCVGIRIYNGINDKDKPGFVLVGVDASGNDLLGASFRFTKQAMSPKQTTELQTMDFRTDEPLSMPTAGFGNGEDMAEGFVLDDGPSCPDHCPPSSFLNQ